MAVSPEHKNWTLVRTVTGFTDDTDHVDLQTAPSAAEQFHVTAQTLATPRGAPGPVGVQVFVTFIDGSDDILDPDTGTTRGTFDLEILEIVEEGEDAGGDATEIIVDGTSISSCSGYKVYEFDGYRNSVVWPRLTNITEPSSGSPAKYQVWMRSIQ